MSDAILSECQGCHDLFEVDSEGLEYCKDCRANYCRECHREHDCRQDEDAHDHAATTEN